MDYLLSKMSHLHQAETQARDYFFTEDGSYNGRFPFRKKPGNFGGSKSGISDW